MASARSRSAAADRGIRRRQDPETTETAEAPAGPVRTADLQAVRRVPGEPEWNRVYPLEPAMPRTRRGRVRGTRRRQPQQSFLEAPRPCSVQRH